MWAWKNQYARKPEETYHALKRQTIGHTLKHGSTKVVDDFTGVSHFLNSIRLFTFRVFVVSIEQASSFHALYIVLPLRQTQSCLHVDITNIDIYFLISSTFAAF